MTRLCTTSNISFKLLSNCEDRRHVAMDPRAPKPATSAASLTLQPASRSSTCLKLFSFLDVLCLDAKAALPSALRRCTARRPTLAAACLIGPRTTGAADQCRQLAFRGRSRPPSGIRRCFPSCRLPVRLARVRCWRVSAAGWLSHRQLHSLHSVEKEPIELTRIVPLELRCSDAT
jgi:hypothetical protein